MEEHRDEVYERIPWETLEEKGKDRQWLVLGVGAAVVAGALAYSFVSNRQAPLPSAEPPPATAAAEPSPAPVTPAPAPPPTATAPSIVAEADLFAVDPDRLAGEAMSHARWLVREYLTADGSDALRALLPADVPLPSLPEGVVVFVEWVDSVSVEEIDLVTYRVSVLARYMVSTGGGEYVRMEPEMLTVDVAMSGGLPVALSAPRAVAAELEPAVAMNLDELPEAVAGAVLGLRPDAQVVGGRALAGGGWEVVVMVEGPGGVVRPEALVVEP